MIKVLLASQNKASFSPLIDAFENHNVYTDTVETGARALTMLKETAYGLLIVDEGLQDLTGKTLIEQTMTYNPMINCIAVSQLPHKQFHDHFEGMGVLMQLPASPGAEYADQIISHLAKINSLYNSERCSQEKTVNDH